MAEFLNINCKSFNEDYGKGMCFTENALQDVSERKRNNIILAFEEVFVNVLQYNDDDNLEVSIEIEKKDGMIFIRIGDNGDKFNPLLSKDPDISLEADERELGGLGVFLLKQISDYIEYKYFEGRNILTFGVKVDEDN
ncbi:MAG: ATP-binding protein [Clostridiales bacterium]|nr:ATP-binding protein [Clostridiales bacterium]